MELTHEKLLSALDYNKETGLFTWKRQTGRRGNKGEVAGTLDKQSGYIRIKLGGKSYRAHRLAWFYVNKVMPKSIDHIDHVKHNNKFSNLREVTHLSNTRNRSINSNNTSGLCGINFRFNKWIVSIRVNYKSIHVGVFDNLDDAVIARKKAEREYGFHENHGEQLIKEATTFNQQ